MTWTIDLRNLADDTTETSDIDFKTAQFTWAADGTGSHEIDLSKAQAQAGPWNPPSGQPVVPRRVILNESGTRKYAGWHEHLARSGPPSGTTYKATGRGLSSHLDYRVIHGDFNQVEVTRVAAAVAIIAHITSQSDDVANFTHGTDTGGTSGTVTRYYGDGDIPSDGINELAQTQDGGFAWEIDANGKFNTWVPARGTDHSGTINLADSDTTDWELANDISDVVSYITGLGNANGNNQPCGPPVTIDDDSTIISRLHRREIAIQTDTNDPDEMSGLTQEEMRSRNAASIALTTTWIEGRGPWDFGTIWIGDIVNGQLGDEFGGDTNIRCTSVQLTLEDKYEFVQMTWEAS